MINFGAIQRYLFKPIIPIIRIDGVINDSTTSRIVKSLQKINHSRAKALALVINSPGGSPTQSSIISEKIKNYCHDKHLPLYTFAEDMAASGGYYLLCIGDKVYVDNTSLVGSIGVISNWIGLKSILEKNNIERRKFTTNENLLGNRYDIFDDLKEKDKEWLKLVLKDTHEKFKYHVEKFRGQKIRPTGQERENKIYQADVWLGKNAVDLGLADNLGNYEAVLYREFPDSKLINVTTKTAWERYREQFKNIVKLATSRALPWIILYFVVKGCIKLYLILLVLSRGKGTQEVKEVLKDDNAISNIKK